MSENQMFSNPLEKLEEIGCHSIGEGIEWMAAAVEYVRDLGDGASLQSTYLDMAVHRLREAKDFVERAERRKPHEDG